jgi:eukaryotic-like serine/threonine-protein kinase
MRLVTAAMSLEADHSPLSGELTDEQVGHYRIIAEIGEGGCGVVFLAEQAAPVARHVAVKIIKPGMDTREVIGRFAAEQQALARMDHPNIAAVFDAGMTSKGRPYFVMELVRGIRITQFCDQCRLDVPQRLTLFRQVCEAIHHAHTRGIIHRDIKPSNILVTLRNGAPVVKVIDFGIAKALQGRLTEVTLSTVLGQFLGTPAYVSPEQTELSGVEIDARSDIYSLGALLYELLTGSTPIATEDLSKDSLDTVRRRIREEEPLSPAKRLARNGTSGSYQKQVRGDLEWIVMHCLEKDRERRYQSVSDLMLDLQRYLRHEPVAARPQSRIYAFRKFAHRHRALVAGSAAMLLVLSFATVFSVSFALQARKAERQVRTEAASRQEVIDFLRKDLLGQASPRSTPDRDLKLREVLDRAAQKLSGRFASEPLIEASVREVLGSTYGSLGEYAAARTHLARVIAIYQQRFGEEDPRTLIAMNQLIPVLRNEARYAEAERLGERTLREQRRVRGPAHPDTLSTLFELAQVYNDQRQSEAAERLLVQAVDLRTRSLGRANEQTLLAMHELAITYMDQGKLAAAEALIQKTLQTFKAVFPADYPEVLYAMNTLAVIYAKQDRIAEAARLQDQTVDALARVLGREHPDTLRAMLNVAINFEHLGKYAEAESVLLRVLSLQQTLGPEHPSVLIGMNVLGNIYRVQGKAAEAHALQAQTVTSARKVWGADHPTTLTMQRNLAITDISRGRLGEAEALLRSGLETSRRVSGAEHPETLKFALELGALWLQTDRVAQAEPLLRNLVATYGKVAPMDWRNHVAKSLLGEALLRSDRAAEARPLIMEGYRGLQAATDVLPAPRRFELKEAQKRFARLSRGR